MISDWQLKTLDEVCEFYNGQAHEKAIDENGRYIVINSKFISSNNLVNIYQQKLNDLEELKKAVLQKAFSGELTTKPVPHLI